MRRLLKVKVDGSDVLVKFMDGDDEEHLDIVTMECSDPPLQSLKDALQAMAEHLVAICEAPKSWVNEIEVRGVSLSDSDGVRGLTITGLRKLKLQNAPLVLNSPHATDVARSEEDDSGKGMAPLGCFAALEALETEVWRYVDGERQQLELGLDKAG